MKIDTQSPRTTIMTSTPTPARRRRATRVVVPAVPPPEYHEAQPGCFSRWFNYAFIQVMTKLFGRDGRG